MVNIKSIINVHNKEVITEKKTEAVKCNCINKPDCPLPNNAKLQTLKRKRKLHQTLKTITKKHNTEPAKLHLNSVMEIIRNHSIMKNIGQIQNFRRNTGDLKNSKLNLKYNFTF